MTTEKKQSVTDFNIENFKKESYDFVLCKHNVNTFISGVYYPLSSSFRLEDIIIENGVRKHIRYVPGVDTIYKKDQTPDKDDPKPLQNAMFVNGRISVKSSDSKLLEFFMKTNLNASNPNRDTSKAPLFFLVEEEKFINKAMEQDKVRREAEQWVDTASFENLTSYARALNINIDRRIEFIKWDLLQHAKRDPKKFLEGTTSSIIFLKAVVQEAIEKNIIRVNLHNNSVAWTNGNVIHSAPIGKDAVDSMIDSMMGTEDGNRVFELLKQQIAPVPSTKPTKSEAIEKLEEIADDERWAKHNGRRVALEEAEQLIIEGKQLGIITQFKSTFKYAGKGFIGSAKLAAAIVDTPNWRYDLKREIADAKEKLKAKVPIEA